MEQKLALIKPQIDDLLKEKEFVVIAIEGNCTAGKTTLAARLAEVYDCNIFHMDDFFLRPEQRTEERYNEIGGNVDYERFREEVLLPLKSGKDFSYRPFNCKTFTFCAPVEVTRKKLNIIEGSYSMHPFFHNPYDLRILLTVDPQLQKKRICMRPAFLQESFFTKWIPMENRYLEHYAQTFQPDIVL